MRMGIVGKKLGMTQIFNEAGNLIPVTVIDVSDCFITQVKQKDTEGYNAIQVGFGERKPQNVNKATTGRYKKAGVPGKALSKEIKLDAEDNVSHLKAGQQLTASMFAKGDKVDVIANSKGRGFQGVIKRHGYHGADATHGVHEYFRHGGSNGSNTFPGRTLKNKGMPGRMGNSKVTVQKLEVADVREKENLIFIHGAVPGFHTKYVMIRSAKKAKRPENRSWTAA